MKVTLHVTTGPSAGRRIDLRDGLTARIGQSEWSDFSFDSDPKMAEVHFTIQCENQQCFVRVPQQTHPTLLNGEPVSEARLHTGDKLDAGTTSFTVDIEGDAGRHDDADSDDAIDVAGQAPLGATPLVGHLELDEELLTMAEESASSEDFLARLIEAEQLLPASRVQAHLLGNRGAIWWGCLCLDRILSDGLSKMQASACQAAGDWVASPTEENRRAAEAAAEITKYSGPGGTLAAGAFWSEGSLAPADCAEPVPPDARLTGQAVANAILFACVAREPQRMKEKLKECLEIARELVDGKIELPSLDPPGG